VPIVTTTANPSLPSKTIFSDLDISFQKHPIKKDVARKLGSQAVIQSVRNLVLMNFYEKPFKPWVGCNARKLLFENLSPITAAVLRETIMEVIRNNEPRVSITKLDVIANYDSNAYSVHMEFFITNQTETTSVSFLLERIR
jgi:phage baseplate assembly protein W